ncbi:MAG: chromosomal replication initiator protein DnaA [Candidatus Pacebacteria bacterium]|nr:chromosomal replication initiator protein DnaA [Candidatus Paceibacterota bacterium]
MTPEEFIPIWQDACKRLRRLLNEDTYDRWIAGIVPLGFTNQTFRLGVSNDIFSEWLTANYKELICGTLAEITGLPVKVKFETGHEAPVLAERKPEKRVAPAPPTTHALRDTGHEISYNRRFTFDTFVVGENNKFAHAASCAVARAPGKAYNPLFVHGATGLGKTHLLQAVGQEVLQVRKKARVAYMSSEEFANKFIDALRDRALPKFRRHFRSVDLLLIDDVHFFTGKEQLQEEFFHTFNALYNGHKQIILTSDRPPHEIRGLEKRLVSRFEWGLTTEIMTPDIETRVAILRRKQEDHNVKINDDVLFFIAGCIKSNIRRLEGALIRLVSYTSMTGGEITIEKAQQLLRPILEEESSNALTIEGIQRAVAEFFDIRVADMTSKRRPHNIAFPRQVAMYLCRKLTDFSSPAIAESFNRNHATILHAANMVDKRIKKDMDFQHMIGKLERSLKS